jgi:hypothetical protein
MAFAIAALARVGADDDPRRGRGSGFVSRVLFGARIPASVRADKLYLVGFMGAGKTSVASALGRRLGWRSEDVDERIETRERRSVAGIFVDRGEGVLPPGGSATLLSDLLPIRNVVVATRRRNVRRSRPTAPPS